MMLNVLESNVRSYSRSFPISFRSASGSWITDEGGDSYLDFLAGCGSLNYGHNHPVLRDKLLSYIGNDGIAMSLDMCTEPKTAFMDAFSRHILLPRNLNMRMQFCGPTGANAVEAAIKLARKVTGRSNVIAFTNGFHGCSLGALALSGARSHRSGSASMLTNVTRIPYDGYITNSDSAELLEKMLQDASSGVDAPAAIIFEAVQGEGGLNVASPKWAQALQKLAHKHNALLIVDEIQAGCGRTGDFFAFEALGIQPDIVTMAKSISGFGLPMSLVLMQPQHDQWEHAEHNGTFRGNNHAFVTATAAIEHFWAGDVFQTELQSKIKIIEDKRDVIARKYGLLVKGRGLMAGLEFETAELCEDVRHACFKEKLIIEACGPNDEVIRFLPPLTTSIDDLLHGLEIVEYAISCHKNCNKKIEPPQHGEYLNAKKAS